MQQIKGFDYRAGVERALTRPEWRDQLDKVLAAGGRRRHEAGETFAHLPGGRIAFEVYANIDTSLGAQPEVGL